MYRLSVWLILSVSHRLFVVVILTRFLCAVKAQRQFAASFAFGKAKTAPTKAGAVSVTMILSDLSDNLDFGKNALGQCLYRNARTGRL